MAIEPFLALSWAEMQNLTSFPSKIAWLGCHFSPCGKGLSNLPPALPPGSLLIIDDATPIAGHDPELVVRQAKQAVVDWQCCGVLLDFQRPNQEEAPRMAAFLAEGLPCPVAVTSLYAEDLTCPVFLPPLPYYIGLQDFLAPWQGRECWLELALDAETITVTQGGARVSLLAEIPEAGFRDEGLHCHYCLELQKNQALWKLWRTREDLAHLLEEAAHLGISLAVGLYQEFTGCEK